MPEDGVCECFMRKLSSSLVVALDFVGCESKVTVSLPDAVVETHPRIALFEGIVGDRDDLDSVKPKFQGVSKGIPIVDKDLCRFRFPVSGYILTSRSASACTASASVTW